MQSQEWDTIGDFKVSRNLFLGKGQSCQVYYGFNSKNGQKVAAKKIDLNKINARLKKQLENQINNLKDLTSPFIVRLHGFESHENYLYLFLQYCEDLDLKRYLDRHKKKNGLCEAEALMFMRYIIEGYKELHNHNIIHRDIKPANILLKQGIAKLSDFGFSRVVPNPETSQKFTLLGTPLYTAPQILTGQQFSSKCDVWSVGIVFYEMLYAKNPWTGETLAELKQAIFNKPLQFGELKRKEGIKNLIEDMLKINSKDRISWKQIFQNELFRDQIPKNVLNQAKGYSEYKGVFLEYVKTNIVKSYLRFNMEEVDFKESFEPQNQKISIIEKIQKEISHKRNIAFMYAYMLILYYKNISVLPDTVNKMMQFQYSLAMKAFSTVAFLGTTYFYKNPPNYELQTWKTFKESSSYEELKKVLMTDYKILQKMCQQIKFEADKRYKEKKLSQDAIKWFNHIDSNPDKGYAEAIRLNHKQLSKFSSKGVCGLLSFFMEYTSDKKALEDNDLLDFGAFYEKKERDYGLS